MLFWRMEKAIPSSMSPRFTQANGPSCRYKGQLFLCEFSYLQSSHWQQGCFSFHLSRSCLQVA
jgi:hypothetical protein